MAARIRERNVGVVSGRKYTLAGVNVIGNRQGRERCSDVTGNRAGDNPLVITKARTEGGILSGTQTPSSNNTYIWDAFPITSPGDATLPLLAVSLSVPTARILAQGPLTPRVNLPLFVYELKDIPQMLKHAGDYLLGLRKRPKFLSRKEMASWTLAFQFGWKPLIEDILKLCNFADAVTKKSDELQRAQSKNGIRRKVKITELKSTFNDLITIDNSGGTKRQTFDYVQTAKQWATVRWKLRDNDNGNFEPRAGWSEVVRTALGLNRGQVLISIWKALPWSWLIDWFIDLSNHLQASYNMLYYVPTRLCFMTHLRTTASCPPAKFYPPMFSLQLSQTEFIREEKRRVVVSNPTPSVTLKLPFLDGFKLSILGSLAVLKLER